MESPNSSDANPGTCLPPELPCPARHSLQGLFPALLRHSGCGRRARRRAVSIPSGRTGPDVPQRRRVVGQCRQSSWIHVGTCLGQRCEPASLFLKGRLLCARDQTWYLKLRLRSGTLPCLCPGACSRRPTPVKDVRMDLNMCCINTFVVSQYLPSHWPMTFHAFHSREIWHHLNRLLSTNFIFALKDPIDHSYEI